MNKKLSPKISIIGAGNVGTRAAYAAIIKGLAREILLIDINKKKAEGEAMDLSHGMPYVAPAKIMAGDYEDLYDSDIVVVTAGRNQRKGETRIDLIKDNYRLFQKIIPQIVEITPNSILLIVTNPVDILTYAAIKISNLPKERVIGSGTVLDTARFRFLLAKHCNIDARNIHAYIIGEHGDSEFALWSSAMIGGLSIKDFCLSCEKAEYCQQDKELDKIFADVRDSAYHIIERKGETSYGIGLAISRILQAIIKDENSILPVSAYLEAYYGISDICLGVPSILNKKGIKKTLHMKLNEKEQKALKNSYLSLKEVVEKIGI
ncbi:MAG: L-lactate dehydrogenase [Promethearchaeota archaeon]